MCAQVPIYMKAEEKEVGFYQSHALLSSHRVPGTLRSTEDIEMNRTRSLLSRHS